MTKPMKRVAKPTTPGRPKTKTPYVRGEDRFEAWRMGWEEAERTEAIEGRIGSGEGAVSPLRALASQEDDESKKPRLARMKPHSFDPRSVGFTLVDDDPEVDKARRP